MAKEVRRTPHRSLDPRTLYCLADDHRDSAVGPQRTEGCASPQKHCIRATRRSTVLQVRHDRLTDLLAQGQPCLLAALPANMNPCTLPVDILQAQLHDIACTQAQAGKEKQDGSI